MGEAVVSDVRVRPDRPHGVDVGERADAAALRVGERQDGAALRVGERQDGAALRVGERPDWAAQHAARRTLRAQIARLDAELSAELLASFAMRGCGEGARPRQAAHGPATPRLLDLGELEVVRDELAERLRAVRSANAQRAAAQSQRRALLRRMLLEPGRHRFTRISCAELGEPGCGVWQVRPRWGLIGMLAGWWQVKLSSGCPLPASG